MFSKSLTKHFMGFGMDLPSFTQNVMQPSCSILQSITDKRKHSQKSTHVKTKRVHSVASEGRPMQLACENVTLASPLIFFHPGSYNNNDPGTFWYTS
jgi:hypothetical protein